MVCAEPEVWRGKMEKRCLELLPAGFVVCPLLWDSSQWQALCDEGLSLLSPWCMC